MMKPNGYDQAQEIGEFEHPEVGGHHMIIKQVSERQSSTGKPMIVILFDFAANDRQPGFFMNQFKNDTRTDKKWPRRGTQYTVTVGNDGNTSRSFKTFCTCFEKSNNTTINWVEDSAAWCAQFKNKKIGGAFGIVHSVMDSQNGPREIAPVELRWFVTDDKVDPNSVPKEKDLTPEDLAKLNSAAANAQTAAQSLDGFMNIQEGISEELPF